CNLVHDLIIFFFSSRRRHTRCLSDWSSDVCSSDLENYTGTGGKIVHFHKRDSGRAIYTAHDGSVVTRWQVSNDRRFPRVPRSPTAIHDILHLVLSDNPADYCSLPVIIRSNQVSGAIV